MLITTSLWAGNPTEDDFNDGSIDAVWTAMGTGTKTEEDGVLKLTSDGVSYSGEYQDNITGTFDVSTKIKEASYPDDIPNSNQYGALRAYIDHEDPEEDEYVIIYQNRNNTEDKNEWHCCHYNTGFSYCDIVQIDPAQYGYFRIDRDGSNEFRCYYSTDSGENWTEIVPSLGSEYRLIDSGDVQIQLIVRDPGGGTNYTWEYDYLQCESGTCGTAGATDTLNGVSLIGTSIN